MWVRYLLTEFSNVGNKHDGRLLTVILLGYDCFDEGFTLQWLGGGVDEGGGTGKNVCG